MLSLQLAIILIYSPVAVGDYWYGWQSWGFCSTTCGGGTRYRYSAYYYIDTCSSFGHKSVPRQSGSCNTQHCPVNGNWGGWSTWSICTVTCGSGTRLQRRYCNNPSPSYGGSSCCGLSSQSEKCNACKCPVNGNWGHWTSSNICSVTCGGGLTQMIRQCNNPRPSYGGLFCTGSNVVNRFCNTRHCPVNGQWGEWGNWTVCNTTCGDGYQNRTRECDDPEPSYGGLVCPASGYEIRQCPPDFCVAQRFSMQDESGSSPITVVIVAISSCFFTVFILIMFNLIRNRKRTPPKETDMQTACNAENDETIQSKSFDNKEYCGFDEDTNEISLPPRRMRKKDPQSARNKVMKRISTIYENLKIM